MRLQEAESSITFTTSISSLSCSQTDIYMGSTILLSGLLICVISNGLCSSIELPDPTYVEPEYLEILLATGEYEEFARLLHIDDVNLVKPVEGNRSGDPMLNAGLEEGDILPKSWQPEQATQGRMTTVEKLKWNKVVPYVIDEKGYTADERAVILKAIMKWNKDMLPNIGFLPREMEKDYIMIYNGGGCQSYIGRIGGQQPFSLSASGCLTEGIILHEMSHAVGIIHEHNRPDRDNYIKILLQNIPEEWRSQYEKVNGDDSPILGPYDYYSLMHYEIRAPGTDLPAFEVLRKSINHSRIGQRVAQTHNDKHKIKRLYRRMYK